MEIFIEFATVDSVSEWLKNGCVSVGSAEEAGDSVVITVSYGSTTIPVVVTQSVGDTGFTSIWFNSKNLPWSNLGELVESASGYFSSRIRYEKCDLSPVFYELYNNQLAEVAWE